MKRKIGILSLYIVIFIATISTVGFVLGLVNYNNETKIYARTSNNGLQILQGSKWEDFFVKGVNIGAALPGKWFTEFPEDEKVYLDWFDKIGNMNANCIRVYTLLPSQFYSALESYNSKHSNNPIWLLQEIWPEESPGGQDYLNSTYVEQYIHEIEIDIDAIHGNAIIPERKGRAYGVYKKDVSRYDGQKLEGTEKTSRDILAEQVGDSSRTIHRYIRLAFLVPDLLELVDKGRLSVTPAVDVSYFPEQIQKYLVEYINENGFLIRRCLDLRK